MASGKFCESWKRYSADFNMHFIKFTESNNESFQPFYHNKFAVSIWDPLDNVQMELRHVHQFVSVKDKKGQKT